MRYQISSHIHIQCHAGPGLKKPIFDPLGMKWEPYLALADGTPCHLLRPFPEDGKIMQGAVRVQSRSSDQNYIKSRQLLSASGDDISGAYTVVYGCIRAREKV